MTSKILAISLAMLLAAGPAAADIDEDDLLSGRALFGRDIDIDNLPEPGILETDETMRAFVAEQIGGIRSSREKMRRLLAGMVETGLLSLDYEQVETKTARQTFYDRSGNCISFTNLFVALGRAAGLNVAYQTVDIPPIWYAASDLIILNNHINVVVKSPFEGPVVVDFNIPEFKGNYDSFEVNDSYAFALYHNNIAMDALTDGQIETSFRYLKKAIALAPGIAEPWINLGVLYSRHDRPEFALAAYRQGLELDPDNRSAMTNLAYLHRSLGDIRTANWYARKIRAYQKRNPYFHYYRARSAYANDNLDEALDSLKRAIRLKDTEHQFYSLRGEIAQQLGDQEEALASFVRARELAGFGSARRKYDQEISLLRRAPER